MNDPDYVKPTSLPVSNEDGPLSGAADLGHQIRAYGS